ncbi:class I SAM-dependent methyltransferase [Stenotrophomonas rhizophila]|uniref:class I SAM-dependent methyltransferase n=1 Tax=Stenotrophomonas rhizophila TaxID=216778 RepID=UPI001E32DEEC|nr:class I SAM-dependent methyltransferase [Stenotrophomonas rhizophila]MCC7633484.1 class I SAM-dependent methyltransferase [Stenotrophomonas rhizophila]MCC7663031.1 class I SAM-dependent methyltransferase [Stenotrophomonas rhizophila]
MSRSDSTERFSSRVADYVRYRPDYPPALLHWLHHDIGIPTETLVADIGAGTGISTRLFLASGHPVIAVEPNAAMRNAAEQWLAPDYLRLKLVDGTAEATTLAQDSVGLVAAAQAFHWFDTAAVRREWARILHPGGMALVFWNSRLLDASPFLVGYEQLLLEFGTDYTQVAERYQDDDAMRAWFGPGLRGLASFPNVQRMDLDGLRGRLLSSSYAPQAGHRRHAPMLEALQQLFDAHAVDGQVAFQYHTRAFIGTLD